MPEEDKDLVRYNLEFQELIMKWQQPLVIFQIIKAKHHEAMDYFIN